MGWSLAGKVASFRSILADTFHDRLKTVISSRYILFIREYSQRFPYSMQLHSYRMDDFLGLQEQSEWISSILDPKYIDQERIDE